MRTIHLLSFIVLLLSCNSQEKVKNTPLTYHITPKLQDDNPSLEITFKYITDKEGKVVLDYNNNKWGESDLYNCIAQVTSIPESIIELKPDSNQIVIQYVPHQEIDIRYLLVQDVKGPALNERRYRPIIQSDYFHILGHRLLMLPRGYYNGEDDHPKPINIEWNNTEPEFIIHNSFGNSNLQSLNVSREALGTSIFVGGDFTGYKKELKGNDIYFITRSNWKNLDIQQTVDDLNEIIGHQRDFWEDHSDSIYSVTMIPTYELWTDNSKSYSRGGSNLTQSFAAFSSDNPGANRDGIKYLFSHELMHNWISNKIRNENEEQEYWFSEGFTDYYAFKLMLKSGLIDLDEFLLRFNNETIKPHYTSPVKVKPNAEITYDTYWSDYNYQKLPYRRGMIYAFWLDTKIKKANPEASLDTIMRNLLEVCVEEDKLFNSDLFLKMLGNYKIDKYNEEFEKYIINGSLIPLNEIAIEGITVSKEDVPTIQISETADRRQLELFIKR